MTPSRSRLISTALRRGLRKRCPHCGEGRLFSGWSQLERCSICGLVFVRNPGDTWAFTIIGDRVPVAAILVLVYFGVVRSHPVLGLALMVGLVGVLVWTAPNRWGAGIALHYLSRVYWPIQRTLSHRRSEGLGFGPRLVANPPGFHDPNRLPPALQQALTTPVRFDLQAPLR